MKVTQGFTGRWCDLIIAIFYRSVVVKQAQMKQLLFSVTSKDFDMQTFSVGGHGGGGKDTSNSGVRLTHRDSGATAEGREHRTNTQNKKSAFLKLVETKKFKDWHKAECARRMGVPVRESPEALKERVNKMVDAGLLDGSIKVEEYDADTK